MNEVRLEKNIVGKIIFFLVVGIVWLTISCLFFVDNAFIYENGILSILNLVPLVIFLIISAILCTVLGLLAYSHSSVKLYVEGISQWRLFRLEFIYWKDVQEIEFDLGSRIIKSENKIIQVDLSDFKDPGQLVNEIETRVPKSARHTGKNE